MQRIPVLPPVSGYVPDRREINRVRLLRHQRPSSGLTSVQALRGLAALAVVLHHVSFIMGQPQYGGRQIWPEAFEFGTLGVNLFFVLSGFIILKAHLADLGRPARLARYLYRRIVRIYPVYWIFLTLYVLAAAVHFGVGKFSWAPESLLQAYVLLPLNADFHLPLHERILPLKVAWTLAYEVEFYALFVIALFSVRLALIFVSFWLVGILVQAALVHEPATGLFSSWNLYFLAGMGVLWLSERTPPAAGPGILAAGLILLAVSPFIYTAEDIILIDTFPIAAYFVPPFALILLGVVLLERRGTGAPAVFQVLGDASYSIYLVHSAAISAVMIFAQRLQLTTRIGPYATYVLVLVTAVTAGFAAYFLIEKPMLRALRKFSPTTKEAGDPRAASGAI